MAQSVRRESNDSRNSSPEAKVATAKPRACSSRVNPRRTEGSSSTTAIARQTWDTELDHASSCKSRLLDLGPMVVPCCCARSPLQLCSPDYHAGLMVSCVQPPLLAVHYLPRSQAHTPNSNPLRDSC